MQRNKNMDSTEAKKAEEDEVIRKEKRLENTAVVVPDHRFVRSEILSRVPIEDIIRWRCVRRSWRDLPIDPYFMQLHWSKYYDVFPFQHYVVNDTELLLVSKNNGTWRVLNIPIQKDISTYWIFVASCHDLILFLQHEEDDVHYIVYNAITKESMRLPVLNLPPIASKILKESIIDTTKDSRRLAIDMLGFGFDQKNIKYKVIFNYNRYSPAIITLGEDSWRILDISIEKNSSFCERLKKPIFFNGAFHWIFHCGCGSLPRCIQGILKLDISTEKFQTISFSPRLEMEKLPVQQPCQFGNSAALFHQKEGLIEIWRILGKNADGSCYHQFKTVQLPTDRIPIPFTQTLKLKLVAALSNAHFLFRAWNNSDGCVFVYDQEKDEVVVI